MNYGAVSSQGCAFLRAQRLLSSEERAVTATSAAIAGSKDYIRMSEKLLELLEAA